MFNTNKTEKSLFIEDIIWKALNVLNEQYPIDVSVGCVLKLLLLKSILEGWYLDKKNQFIVPEEIKWPMRQNAQNELSKELYNAYNALEKANPRLQGFFTNPETNIWIGLNDKTLKNILEIFSELKFKDKGSISTDDLGRASGRLLEKSGSMHKGGVGNFTPKQITKMIVEIISPKPGTSIYDPVCGSGEFLVEAAEFIKHIEKDSPQFNLYGQGINIQDCAIAETNLMLNGIYSAEIRLGNIILDLNSTQDSKPARFDAVLTNPPFGLKFSKLISSEISSNHLFSQFPYGIPRNGTADLLFVQHVLASLKESGKGVMILSRGILFRRGDEEEIRRKIIKEDWIEAIIALAPGIFYHTGISVMVVVFNKRKSSKDKILFIDASDRDNIESKNALDSRYVEQILSVYRNLKEEEGFSRLVSAKEIGENNYDLSVDRYIRKALSPYKESDIFDEISNLHRLEAERVDLEEKIDALLRHLGVNI